MCNTSKCDGNVCRNVWLFLHPDKPHSQYSKLLLASEGQVLQQVILEEKVALLRQYQEEKHTPEACFVEAALQELKVGNPYTLERECGELACRVALIGLEHVLCFNGWANVVWACLFPVYTVVYFTRIGMIWDPPTFSSLLGHDPYWVTPICSTARWV